MKRFFTICIALLPLAALAQDSISTKQLKAVTVNAQKPMIERKADRVVMNVANSALAVGNNALDILSRAPGVTVDQNGALISYRGRSGVTIMINGKLTYLAGDQLIALLRATPGSDIQSVELISNPSAKYDASATAGIINIKMKKNSQYGTNGNLSLSGSAAKYLRTEDGISLNHRNKYFNIYGNYGYDDIHRFRDLKIDRINNDGDVSTVFNEHTQSEIRERDHNYKAGADFFLDANNTIGVLVNGNQGHRTEMYTSNTNISSHPGTIDTVMQSNNPLNRHNNDIAYNLNFRFEGDSGRRELSVDLDYIRYNNKQYNDYDNNFYDADGNVNGQPVVFRNQSPSVITIHAAQVDYNRTIKNTKIEAGVKSSAVHTDNNFAFQNLVANKYENDSTRSNHFIYDENINAAYINAEHKFKSTNVMVGLRGEQTNTKGNSISLNQVTTRHYLSLFPSVFVQHHLNEQHEIGFSYSRKVQRPDYANLNPFTQNFDLYTLGKGNPYLNAEFTHNFEINYSYKDKLQVSAGYSLTDHAITEVTLPDTANKTLYVQDQNMASKRSFTLNVSAPLQVTPWWHMENNVTMFYNRFSTPELLGRPFSAGMLSVQANSYQQFKVSEHLNAELSLLYISPRIRGTYHIATTFYADMGVRYTFLKDNRASIKFAVDDLFNTRKENIQSVVPGQTYHIYQKFDTQIAHIGFSYRFGGKNVKEARDRTRSSQSEEQRAGH
jgi:outer membrane receptor protein involved in Fe transport